MPTYASPTPNEIDARRWAECLRQARASLVAQGRHPRALCPVATLKRARRLFYAA